MGNASADPRVAVVEEAAAAPQRLRLLYLVFALSGAAGLIYEIVWFQLLQLIIGGSSQSLGLLLACFMGGLFAGSLLYARLVPYTCHPLRAYALLEAGIAVAGLAVPHASVLIRASYFAWADSPQLTFFLRGAVCAALLVPPTALMGATLPALARYVRTDARHVPVMGRLYAVNIVGAVAGVFTGLLVLLPAVGLLTTSYIAAGFNGAVALLALVMSLWSPAPAIAPHGRAVGAAARSTAFQTLNHGQNARATSSTLPVFVAYGLSGLTALSFEVLWSRLLSLTFGATVFAFGVVLGLFLVGLSAGSAIASALIPRLKDPRRTLVDVQLGVIAAGGLSPLIIPAAASWLITTDIQHEDTLWVLSLTNVLRAAVVVLPATILWGMAFPLALASLGRGDGDPARPVGRLYAWNTMGAVLGSLAAGFVLIPHVGSATAAGHLVLLPLLAVVALGWPRFLPARGVIVLAVIGVAAVYSTLPQHLCGLAGDAIATLDRPIHAFYIALLPAFLGFELFLIRREARRLAVGGAVSGLLLAVGLAIPQDLYKLGRNYGSAQLMGDFSGEIVLCAEGATEAVTVYRSAEGPLTLSVNGQICASAVPAEMAHLRLLGHVPVLLSADPGRTLVVGLGAGVTAGCAAIHETVEHVQVVELEPVVTQAAALFAEDNHGVMTHPKVRITFDDGRHFIATTDETFGVITSDPIEPFWMGSSGLYTVEYYRTCRDRLVVGGTFMQWLGVFGMDPEGVRSLLAAFAEAFPDGTVWLSERELMLLGSNGPIVIDVEALQQILSDDGPVDRSLAEVGIDSADDLLATFVCSVAALEAELAGATPNRDDNLLSQYVGWHGYYRVRRASRDVRVLLDGWREHREDLFALLRHAPPGLREAIRERWSADALETQPF